jgi:hypothetical protein
MKCEGFGSPQLHRCDLAGHPGLLSQDNSLKAGEPDPHWEYSVADGLANEDRNPGAA